MTDRALFVGFGAPVRGREERAVEVFGEFVQMFGRMQSDGRIAAMDVTLLDPHGGDLGGFFMVHGSESQRAAVGVVPAVTGDGVGRQMAMYGEAVGKVGIVGHALAGARNGG